MCWQEPTRNLNAPDIEKYTYYIGLKLQYKSKFKLPLDMVSKHVLRLYFHLPEEMTI